MLERVVTPEMVRERWEEVYGADGQRVDARWILLTIPQPPVAKEASREEIERAAEEAGAAVRAKADAIVRRLSDGEDFAALARQYSEDSTTRDRGGLLPDRFRPERWPKPVADVVQSLEPGTYTAPQPLGTAWAIFEVVAKRRIAFEEVKDDLAEQLAHEPPARPDLSAYRNVLTRDVKVEVLPPMYQ
jgi:parvulin-like peptidyl-prolyl isomerase